MLTSHCCKLIIVLIKMIGLEIIVLLFCIIQGKTLYKQYRERRFIFLFQLSGCALLGYGGYIKNNKEPPLFRILTIILDYVHLSFPWLLIMTAIVCILVSFLGCCGALKKIRGMLTMVKFKSDEKEIYHCFPILLELDL